MPITSVEKLETRRFCGYPVSAALLGQPIEIRGPSETLDATLLALDNDELTVLRTVYLANLTVLEVAIPNTGEGLDLKKAAVYERNGWEMAEREALLNSWRLKLCAYLGIPAGPGVYAVSTLPGATPGGSGSGGSGGSGGGSGTGAGQPPAIYVV